MKRLIYILTAAVLAVALLTTAGVLISRNGENKTQVASLSQVEQLLAEEYALPRYASSGTYPLYSDEAVELQTDPDLPTENRQDDAQDAPTESKDDPTENGDDVVPTAPADEEDEADENPFAAFFGVVSGYATEILSALTLVGSLILAYAYKKGLIPLISGGIKALGGAVTKIKDSAERAEGASKELGESLCQRLSAAEACLGKISEALESTAATLDKIKLDEGERLKTTLVLTAQIDMLYELFMSSALPQYKKDEVGERISEMRRAVAELDTE